MNNSKLISILQSFTPKELKEFDAYIHSRFFNSNQQVAALSRYLKKNLLHSGKGEQEITNKIIFDQLFPKQKFNEKKVGYLFSDLTRHVEDYLVYKAVEKNNAFQTNILAKELGFRNCEKAYNAAITRSRESIINALIKDADFYYSHYYAEHTHLLYATNKQQRKEKSNIETVVQNLDNFYLARKLQLCCEMYNIQNVLSANYRIFLLDEILNQLRDHPHQVTPIVGIYYQVLMTLKEPEKEEHFFKLKALLVEHGHVLSISELREVYKHAFNYCIKKINLGNIHYQQTLFELYKITLSNKVLLTDNILSQWEYKNIVTISLRLQEYGWAKEFIVAYKNFLLPSERENALTYNLAYWHFHKKEYSTALSLLQKVNFTDLYYQLDTRAIILKIYYELNDTDALFYYITAFKTFLKRNKVVSDYQRNIYKNFLKYTAKLVRLGSNKRKIVKLKQEIEQVKQIADIQWLLQKVAT